jgi:hypothetical protein
MVRMTTTWQDIGSAPPNVPVETKIDDANGPRNYAILKRQGRLWFTRDGSMYVYYTPTHWRPSPPSKEGE